jgi:hypothetical protein
MKWLALIVCVACGRAEPLAPGEEVFARAAKLTASLAPAELARQIAANQTNADVKVPAFPVQRATLSCDGATAYVMYNPYRDLMKIGFATQSAIDEDIRTISFGATRVWADSKKFTPQDLAMEPAGDDPERVLAERSSVVLEQLSKKRWFPGDEDVTLELGALAMTAQKVDDGHFRYMPKQHRGWRVRLHTFTPGMAEAIAEHASRAQAAAVELHVLGFYAFDVESLRKFKDPKITSVVKRYDELVAAARARLAQAGAMPHGQYATAFALEHVPPCSAARRSP